jgi:hypothetical protein
LAVLTRGEGHTGLGMVFLDESQQLHEEEIAADGGLDRGRAVLHEVGDRLQAVLGDPVLFGAEDASDGEHALLDSVNSKQTDTQSEKCTCKQTHIHPRATHTYTL